jgi:hypothetical protein
VPQCAPAPETAPPHTAGSFILQVEQILVNTSAEKYIFCTISSFKLLTRRKTVPPEGGTV